MFNESDAAFTSFAYKEVKTTYSILCIYQLEHDILVHILLCRELGMLCNYTKAIYISPAFDALHDPPGGFHECAVMEFVTDVKHFSYACISDALSTDITGVESGIEHTTSQIGSLLIGIEYCCSNCIHNCIEKQIVNLNCV